MIATVKNPNKPFTLTIKNDCMPHENAYLIIGGCCTACIVILFGSIIAFDYLQKRKISRQIERQRQDFFSHTDIAEINN